MGVAIHGTFVWYNTVQNSIDTFQRFQSSVGSKGTSKSTKNATTLWEIKTTADKKVKYKFNGDTVTAYRDPKTCLWWGKDINGHGDSVFKVFKKEKNFTR
ncbi:hypothetical protein WAZ07_21800 [Bacillus sp. FJAT-51639]|uniref:Uncharacterized protein n=1 Tax=Bacillus bruguierae TaxID=3127667 RepID=A0ABU8FMA3_9BACI